MTMKKVQTLNLIASICLLIGVVLNLLNHFTDLPPALYVFTIPLCLAAIILFTVALKHYKQSK